MSAYKKDDTDYRKVYSLRISDNELLKLASLNPNLVIRKNEELTLNTTMLRTFVLNLADINQPNSVAVMEPVVSNPSSKFSPDEDTLKLLNEEHQVEIESVDIDQPELITEDEFLHHMNIVVAKNGNTILLRHKGDLRRNNIENIKNGLPDIEEVLLTNDDDYLGNRQERLDSLEVVKQYLNQQ